MIKNSQQKEKHSQEIQFKLTWKNFTM